jgi:hypothetical protein
MTPNTPQPSETLQALIEALALALFTLNQAPCFRIQGDERYQTSYQVCSALAAILRRHRGPQDTDT